MAFWGTSVKPSKESAFVPPPESGEKLHLSQACLAPGGKKGSRATLLVRVSAGEPLAVCALKEGANESAALDLVLDEYTEFSVSGDASVHLTGYYMPDYELDREDDDDEDEDDEDADMAMMGMNGAILGYDDFGVPVLADEYDSEEDSDYESEDDDEDFDSAEEDLLDGGIDGNRRRSGTVTIEDITEALEKDLQRKSLPSPATNGKHAAEFDDSDVSGSDEEESEEEEEEEEESSEEEEEKEEEKKPAAPTAAEKKRKAAAEAAAQKAAKVQKAAEPKPKAAKAAEMKKPADTKKAETPAAGRVASTKKSVRRFANGFEIEDVSKGLADAKLAKPGKRVVVKYVGKLKNGTVFDQTKGNKTFAFRLGVGEVIKGWDRGVEGMRVGDVRKLVIPPQMGYGSSKVGSIPANSTLHFDVELVDVKG